MRRVTEEPYKIPHFASLLRALDDSHDSTASTDALMSKLVLDDFWKGFQAFLDKLAWREVRLCVSLSCLSPGCTTLFTRIFRFTSLHI